MSNREIKVSIVAPNISGKGGTETVLENVINYADYSHNFIFTLFLSDGTKDNAWLNNLNIIRNLININDSTGVLKFLNKVKYFIKTKDEILLILGPRMIFIAWLVRLLFFKKYKIVSWIHFSLFHGNIMNPKYLKYADKHLAIATQIGKQLEELKVDDNDIFTIYNPVKRSNDVIPAIEDDLIHIIYVGRVMLNGQKNLIELFNALSLLDGEIGYELHLFGSGTVTELAEARQYAATVLKNGKVVFHGWTDNPWNMISKADVLVLTSKYEGFGLVLTEAISRGLPVITSNCPVGPDDIVQSGVNGYFYNSGSEMDLLSRFRAYKDIKKMNRDIVKNSLIDLYDTKYFERFEKAIVEVINE